MQILFIIYFIDGFRFYWFLALCSLLFANFRIAIYYSRGLFTEFHYFFWNFIYVVQLFTTDALV